jgi:hypothetical protein
MIQKMNQTITQMPIQRMSRRVVQGRMMMVLSINTKKTMMKSKGADDHQEDDDSDEVS